MIQRSKKGFTIIELMLSMSFVSMLLITIALMTMQMSNIYLKGNTMKDLSAAGRSINDEFTHTFNSLPSMNWTNVSSSFGSDKNYVVRDGGGAFCTGSYSYLWNNASVLGDDSANKAVLYNGASSSRDPSIRLIKVMDTSMGYCRSGSGTYSWNRIPKGNQTVDLLPAGENGLMLYDIQFFSNNDKMFDSATSQRAINISYVLGTKNNGQIDVSNMSCRPPAEVSDNQNYCAINKFEILVRTLGKK